MSGQDVSALMGKVGARIDFTLNSILEQEKAKGAPPRLVEAMAYAVLGGGKRVRGFLVYSTAQLLGCAPGGAPGGADERGSGGALNEDALLRLGAGYECLHGYSLIHDDLPSMDNAETRRGKPTCHIKYGENLAILAGDALQALAFNLMAEAGAEFVTDLAKASGASGMVGGQVLDLEAEMRGFTEAEVQKMQAMKTGALISGAVVAGGRSGGGDATELSTLDQYGELLGRAFQITDDLLDIEGEAGAIGKPKNQDATAGKATLINHLGTEPARNEAKKAIASAKSTLKSLQKTNKKWHQTLEELADYVITRKH